MSGEYQGIVDEFLLDRRISGRSPKTIEWHRFALKKYGTFLSEFGYSEQPSQWTTAIVRHFLAWITDQNYAQHTIASYARSFFAFSRWLVDEGYTETNVQGRIKRPPMPKDPKDPFTDDELRRLFVACDRSQMPLRDRAILSLLLDCGLRASELKTLQMTRLHLKEGMLSVHGKGGKDRLVPFGDKTALALRRYINQERPASEKYNEVFLAKRGTPFSINALLQIVRRLGERGKVVDVHPHRFRHTFAVSYLRNGGDPLSLQRMLGHTTLAMTNRYVNLNGEDLKAKHEHASPLTHLTRR